MLPPQTCVWRLCGVVHRINRHAAAGRSCTPTRKSTLVVDSSAHNFHWIQNISFGGNRGQFALTPIYPELMPAHKLQHTHRQAHRSTKSVQIRCLCRRMCIFGFAYKCSGCAHDYEFISRLQRFVCVRVCVCYVNPSQPMCTRWSQLIFRATRVPACVFSGSAESSSRFLGVHDQCFISFLLPFTLTYSRAAHQPHAIASASSWRRKTSMATKSSREWTTWNAQHCAPR